jgi:pilus assembly protein CpaE
MRRQLSPQTDDPWAALVVDDPDDGTDQSTGEIDFEASVGLWAGCPAPPSVNRVVMFGAGGGVGVSVLASGLALCRARRNEEVLLVDFDLERGDLAVRWDVPPDRSLGDLVEVVDEIDTHHVDLVSHRDATGVQLLFAPGMGEATRIDEPGAVARLVRACGVDRSIIIDGGSAVVRRASALAAGATAIVVAHPTIVCARRTVRLADALTQWQARRIVIVLNRGCPDDELSTRAFARTIGQPVLAELPRANADAAAIGAGRWPRRDHRGLPAAIASLIDLLDAE